MKQALLNYSVVLFNASFERSVVLSEICCVWKRILLVSIPKNLKNVKLTISGLCGYFLRLSCLQKFESKSRTKLHML